MKYCNITYILKIEDIQVIIVEDCLIEISYYTLDAFVTSESVVESHLKESIANDIYDLLLFISILKYLN